LNVQRTATKISAPVVQNLWRTEILCGKGRKKPEETSRCGFEGLAGSGENYLLRRKLTAAAKAGAENRPVTAAVTAAPPKIKCNSDFFRSLQGVTSSWGIR
jgi:hypothetical protein